jgi:uncharacterized repeat protein (TIGR01451 family)
MKKYTTLVGWAILLGVWSGWSVVAQIHAQSTTSGGQIDGFTFFIPFPAEDIDDRFAEDRVDANVYVNQPFEYTISIAILSNDTVVYYDEWEDGLESNLTSPEQPSTKIWGDTDTTNNGPGSSVTFAPPGGGILTAGTVITLRNQVPTNPRDPSQIFFDGGDKLTAVGGPIAVAMMVWMRGTGPGVLYADAWELYPTSRWGHEYIVPIGENLIRNLSTDPTPPSLPSCNLTLTNSFRTVSVNVQAVEDNTTVEIDLDGNGTVDVTTTPPLNQGEQILQSDINVGARVRANVAGNDTPVQVVVIASDPCRTWEMRGYTLIPLDQWTHDYLAPRASDGDFWLFNPNSSPLLVSAQTISGTTAITIPALSTGRYPPPGDPLLGATGVHFTANEDFYGVAALDAASAQDWGHALQPTNLLTAQTLVGLGLGNDNRPPGPRPGQPGSTGFESRVYVTAVNATNILVDYNNDGNPEFSRPVAPLEEVAITDPDFDMTGAFLSSDNGTPFASVWGQDQTANAAEPSIDAGTSVVPLPSLLLQKTFRLKLDSDCNGAITRGDTIQFKLQHFNNTINPIPNIIVTDTLPPEVTYQSNTTLLNGALIPDDSSGATPFPLDLGGYNVGDVPPKASGILTFDVVLNDDSKPFIINEAHASSEDLLLESDDVEVAIKTQPMPPLLEINKALVDPTDGVVVNGQTITFGLTITNTSNIPMTTLRLQDTFNENHLTFLNAGPPPDLVASGVITWNDLTTTFGDLSPGATINATVSFVVGQLFPTITNTVNAVIVEAQRSNTPALLTCPASAIVGIAEPAIHVKKATNGFDADNPNNDPVPQIKPGDPVTWDYVVTNIGNVPLSNVTLVDDQLALLGVTPSFIGGDTNNDNRLDLDETWLYRATGVAEDLPNSNRPRGQCGPGGFEAPLYTNMATATGEFGPTTVIDDDPSHYCPPPPNDDGGCQGDCTPPTPPPPPPPTPPVVQAPTPPPVLPVVFLPETGYREFQVVATRGGFVWLGLALLSVSIAVLWLRRKT